MKKILYRSVLLAGLLTTLTSTSIAASYGKIDMFNNVELRDLSFEVSCTGFFCNDHGLIIRIGNEQHLYYIEGIPTYNQDYIQGVADKLNARVEEMEEKCFLTGRVDIEGGNNRFDVNPNTIDLTCSIL